MAEFARGARIKKAVEEPLTFYEAAFVVCSVADGIGVKTAEEFMSRMRHAWDCYLLVKRDAEGKDGGRG